MSDFEQQIPAPLGIPEIKQGIEGEDFSGLKPEVVSLDKFRLRKATPEDLKKRLEGWDLHTIKEITKVRPNFEVQVGEEEDEQVYVKRLGKTDKDQDLIFVYERGLAISGRGTFPTSCNDILVEGENGQFLSLKSLFPDSDKLGISLALLDIDPGDIRLSGSKSSNLLAFGLSFAYNSESHSLKLFEPNGDINLAIASHEAGHAWARKLNLISDNYRRVFFDNDEELDQVETYDKDMFLRIREQKNDERLASFISRQIVKRVRDKSFSLKSGEISDGRDAVLEPALMSYDTGFAYALIRYADHFDIDATKLFGARFNRTSEGIQAIRDALNLCREVQGALSPQIESLLKNGRLEGVGNDWNEPYPRRYESPSGDFQLEVYITAKGKLLGGNIEVKKGELDWWKFEWSPYTGVHFYDESEEIRIVPGIKSSDRGESTQKLREKTLEVEKILKSI